MGLGMLLADDGHQVTIFERDPEPPPADGDAAWGKWERRGINQFRLLHSFLARYHRIVATELPRLLAQMRRDGALESNVMRTTPDFVTGGWRDGDERYDMITGRRPVMERAVAAAADATPGITIRRGVSVSALVTGPAARPGTVHVTGVRTDEGGEVPGDLIIDAGGRRSALPSWLEEAGAAPLPEEREDGGFIYFGRHFRSSDGSIPFALGAPLQEHGSISSLTLPADQGTWGVGLVARADDRALWGLRDPAAFDRTVRALPTVAHWLDGDPIDDGVAVMAKIEDRIRHLRRDGNVLATGVVPVADAWACTNPSLGRGASIGMLHATVLRDTLRDTGLDQPWVFAEQFADRTSALVEPWYRTSVAFDRGRLGEMAAMAAGQPHGDVPDDYGRVKALQAAMMKDPDCFRAFLDMANVLALPDDILARPGTAGKVAEFGRAWRDEPLVGPDRADLIQLVNQ
jgi:2-polyprenyl-6-methoxyphenol hydroxylase-like FAD-dependent oxidoreductase